MRSGARENPNVGELNDRGERKLLLRKFPYKVVYRTEGERIFVVAVAHHTKSGKRIGTQSNRGTEKIPSLFLCSSVPLCETHSFSGLGIRGAGMGTGTAGRFPGDEDEIPAQEADVEATWAEEAHRRWEAHQRSEEEMLDFDEVMAEIRASFR